MSVVSLTSDGASPNRRFYNLCQQQSTTTPYKAVNPYSYKNQHIYLFCDAPHLLKTTRNCFSNSFSHSQNSSTEGEKLGTVCYNLQHNTLSHFCILQKNGQFISWKAIESLYLSETEKSSPGIRLCHKLSSDHIWLNSYTRMRVNLAAQVCIS